MITTISAMILSDDWRDKLRAFADANPDLPDGPANNPDPESAAARQPRLDISLESKGRAGKKATLVTGWTCPDSELREIASNMKTALATGGSARGGDILIQGDRRKDVAAYLTRRGYKSRII